MVSIIIPTYNRAKCISRAIESAIQQTYKDIEIIVVDDNSRDETSNIVETYTKNYSNIKYIKHSVNKGGSAARNTGVRNSNGDIIAFLDSDDELAKDKIEKCIRIFNEKKDVAMIYTDVYFINEINKKEYIKEREDWDNSYLKLLRNNIIGGTSSIVVTKEAFSKINGFNESLPSCQDWDFYIRLARNYRPYRLAEPLTKYYIHPESISGNKNNAINGHLYIMEEVKSILSEDFNKKMINKIIAEQCVTIAQIYSNFNDFENAKIYYSNALRLDLANRKAIKNCILTFLGSDLFIRVKKYYSKKKNSLFHSTN
ncbi:glycosyltransferase family 2 protein [Clostridium beijerinckii]|uniref:glycosyltransferase family 2 protein n=1 Tax=Clostridium beijerinckii TaxID=1520 RepID=UPI000684BB11|nr:glycosyltransferase [Clostridium beijerinckii]